tara:strand:+ start:8079 stop:8750 length:672 start_codon:yes stop_codon:yes gene_type:complete
MAADSPTLNFLYKYSEHQEFFLSHPFLWKVSFIYEEPLITSINAALEKSPDEKWRVIRQPKEYADMDGSILVARSVQVPNENTEFDLAGGDNLGGFLPGYVATRRANFLLKNLVINFFDTEDDIEHVFFRPWMVALGIDGLMMRNLICPTVRLTQYNNKMERRKGYEFVDVFPTNVEGYSLSYDNEEFLEKSVTFAFKNYKPLPIYNDVPGIRSDVVPVTEGP